MWVGHVEHIMDTRSAHRLAKQLLVSQEGLYCVGLVKCSGIQLIYCILEMECVDGWINEFLLLGIQLCHADNT